MNFLQNGEFWEVAIKVLTTALLSAGVGLVGTAIGGVISRNKNSKIYRYASICVKAAEKKFPNEGKKMCPEKMVYVMDQLAVKFPKIKSNAYFYNMAEAAVFELNKENEQEEAAREFEEKYGEKPLAVLPDEENIFTNNAVIEENFESNSQLEIEEESNSLTTKEKNIITEEKQIDTKEKELQKIEGWVLEVVEAASGIQTAIAQVKKEKLSIF